MLILNPLLNCNNIFCHIPNLLDGAAALNVEGIQNILCLGTDGSFIGDGVGDGPHLLPVELLGVEEHPVVQVGFVDVQVHHAGVRTTALCQIGVTEAAAHLSGTTPVLALGLHLRVAALDHAGDDGVTLASTLQVGHHLAHGTTGIQLAQPSGGVGIGVVRGFLLLDIHQYHGYVQVAHGGQHIVRGSVGQQLQNDKNVASIITFYKGLVKKPAQAAADFVKNANMASGFIFIGLFAIVEVVLSVVYLLSSVIGSIGGFGFSFYPASFFEGIFSGIVGEAVRVLILAAVILVVLNAVQKDKKVTFAQTLSAACLYDAVSLPNILEAAIFDLIPFQFFGNVSGWLHTFAGVVGYVSIFFGVMAIEEDDNKLPLVCGLAFLATAMGSTIVNAIF